MDYMKYGQERNKFKINMVLKIIVILFIQSVVFGSTINQNVELDNIINVLLDGDDVESEETVKEVKEEQPIFDSGIWKCGNCDTDKRKLIYTEVNDIDTNDISDDRPIVVQVGLNLDSMQCVTVTSSSSAAVRRENGACAGDAVTLAVFNAKHFLVHVYA